MGYRSQPDLVAGILLPHALIIHLLLIVCHYLSLLPAVFLPQFKLPRLQGKIQIRVKVMGSTTFTNALTYTYPGPVLQDANPKLFDSDGGTLLTVTGDNFGEDLYTVWANRRAELGPLESLIDVANLTYNQVVLSSLTETLESPCRVQSVRGPPNLCVATLLAWLVLYSMCVVALDLNFLFFFSLASCLCSGAKL